MFGKTDINLNLKLDTDQLSKNLDEMSAQLPDKVTDSSYYIDGNDLIVTPGKTGNVVDVETSIQNIKDAILSLSDLDQPIELAVKTQEPEKLILKKYILKYIKNLKMLIIRKIHLQYILLKMVWILKFQLKKQIIF